MRPAWRAARQRRRGRRQRLLVAATAAAVLAGVAGSTLPAASADPGDDPPAPQGPRGSETPPYGGAPEASHTITLITGDVVTLTGSQETGYTVEVQPRQRRGVPRFLTRTGPEGVYVLPSDAMPGIRSGWLDVELFNVSYLAEHGLGDADSDALPLIVTYAKPPTGRNHRGSPDDDDLARRTTRLPGAHDALGLSSVNGAGVEVDKKAAGEFWQRLRDRSGAPDARDSELGKPAGGVAKVWLDGVAHVVLDESVPLVGAPTAWKAGFDGSGTTVAVLDTGVDPDHPDLAGQVVAATSFVDGFPAQDGHGHGTHVASTVLGTGAASDGRYQGVAPGAELLSGRVCDDSGRVCPFSSMIAGMEWASEQRDAEVVSMSLAGPPTDGTDPVSQAVNSLTASTGSLFVIAAGNAGRDVSVGSPGAADAALTVAATDKEDRVAGLSSRGPRLRDLALKPDLAAPGIGIVAARAAGTGMGWPVDNWYTASDGTSMATPHVSGAAAILAQRHPDWEAERLKAALMSTATDVGASVYAQGAGRLDIGRAATQDVYAGIASIDFGRVLIPLPGEPSSPPLSRQVRYTNLSDKPMTLTLTGSLRGTDGATVPDETLTVDPSVTVPAGGAASATVTVDVSRLGEAKFTGAVVATDEATGTRLRTPVGLVREQTPVELTIHTLGRDGEPLTPWGQDIVRLDGPGDRIRDVSPTGEGTTVVQVPAGVYSIMQVADWVDDDSRLNSAMLFEPELEIDTDTEITLDLRDAEQVRFDTPRPAEPLNNRRASAYQRSSAQGVPYGGLVDQWAPIGSWARLWATPTDQVHTGSFRFWTQALLGKSEVDLTMVDASLALHPAAPLHAERYAPSGTGELLRYQDAHPGWVPFTGTREVELVDVGSGDPADLVDVDVEGRLALVAATARFDSGTGTPACGVDIAAIQRVRDAGADGLVVYPAPQHPCGKLPIPLQIVQRPSSGPPGPVGIPNVHVSTREGTALRDHLATGPVALRVAATPQTPYTYVLKTYEEGRVPETLHYTLDETNLAELTIDYHASRSTSYSEEREVWKPDDGARALLSMGYGGSAAFVGPRSRTEYFGPVSDEVLHTRIGRGRQGGRTVEGYHNRVHRNSNAQLFVQPEAPQQDWYVTPKTPGVATGSEEVHELAETAGGLLGPCLLCRQSGRLFASFRMVTGPPAQGQHDSGSGSAEFSAEESYSDFDLRFFQDGEEVQPEPGLPWALFPMAEDEAEYRLSGRGERTDVTWTFTSAEPGKDTRQEGYACFLEMVEGSTDPCAPVPIVFVSYDMGESLAADNTVRAPGAQRFTVHAFHSPSSVPMPPVTDLQLWVSYGDESWRPVQVREVADGVFEAKVVHPPDRRRDTDKVNLRVVARDAAGNTIDQVTRDAYTLADR